MSITSTHEQEHMPGQEEGPLLTVENLGVTFYTTKTSVRAVRDTSFEIRRGEVLGVVGESGCGKSTVAFAVMGYLGGSAQVDGKIIFAGQDINQLTPSELEGLRGNRIAMVYQDPATSLNPSMRVGEQLEEVVKQHLKLSGNAARQKVTELFESVSMPSPERVGANYPHQLSGGMQQRVMIAMALACDPDLLIMDEPTTGLDVTTEATILDLVDELKDRVNAGILFVSHNLGVIARISDRVAVMYAGQTVEQGTVKEIFTNPQHPYTVGLLSCLPKPPTEEGPILTLSSIPGSIYPSVNVEPEECLFASRCPMAQDQCRTQAPPITDTTPDHMARCFYWQDVSLDMWAADEVKEPPTNGTTAPLIAVKGLRRFYGNWRRKYLFFGPRVDPPVRAVVDVNFEVKKGHTLGIVGESGSGKSTVARTLVGLNEPTRGDIQLKGEPLAGEVGDRTKEQQGAIRMVFQNPTASLNPKLPVNHALFRALRRYAGLSGKEAYERAVELFEAVGLDASYLERKPGELSGGQLQRVALATAFAGDPDFIVADEAVSALDVSVQAQVLNLLESHQKEAGTSYVFISHDLGVTRYVSDEIMVLYAGHVAEFGKTEDVLQAPSHPYTEALLSSVPIPDPDAKPTRIRLQGSVPTLRGRFPGCFFAGRCPRKIGSICDESAPPAQVTPGGEGHVIHCHIPLEELAAAQQPGAKVPGQQ